MEYNRIGLKITLEELEYLLERAKKSSCDDNMEGAIYIKVNCESKPKIIQYSNYAGCSSIDYTDNG